MEHIINYLFVLLVAVVQATLLFAQPEQVVGFMSARDELSALDSASGITLKNISGSTIVLTGFYLQGIDSSSFCNAGLLDNAQSSTGGVWTSVSVPASGTAIVGANFLYNMIVNAAFIAYTFNPGGGGNFTPGTTGTYCIQIGLSTGSPVQQGGADSSFQVYETDYTHTGSASIVINCTDATESCIVSGTPNQQQFPILS